MATRYTSSDIEIHLSDWTQGMDTAGIDIEASIEKAREAVREAVQARYPQYSVSVFTERANGFSDELVGWPSVYEETPDGRKVEAWDAEAFLRQEIESTYQGMWDNFDAWMVETQKEHAKPASQSGDDLGAVTPEQLAAYLAAEPSAHFVLRDSQGEDWDPRSPAYWPDGLEGDSGNTIIDDWQSDMRLIRLP